MLADYGQEVIDQLLEQNQEIKPMKINDFIAKHEEFKVKIELLKKQYWIIMIEDDSTVKNDYEE